MPPSHMEETMPRTKQFEQIDADRRENLSDMPLSRAISRVGNAPLRTGNRLTLLQNGPATYEDWLAAIAQAKRWIHLENYIFQNDSIGQTFADALAERAQAGVKVRVIYDWWGSLDVPNRFWKQMRKRGIDVRVINPLWVGAPLEAINRDHRKSLCIDGVYASVGGVCIADPWLARSPVTGLPYRDTAVRVEGPVIADLERAFADVWATAGSPLPDDELPDLDRIEAKGTAKARVVAEEPGRLRMLQLLQVLLAGAERRIWIADAYFLTIPILREALMGASRDGVDVRILLPSTNDLPLVGALSRYGYRPLLESGIRIWEYAGLMMHAKTTVTDGWCARVGSTNLNMTGLLTNWEIDLIAEDRDFAKQMEEMYEDDLAHAREIRLWGIRRPRPRPERPESTSERLARRTKPERRSQHSATVARMGAAALGAVSSRTLQRHERMVGAAITAGLLGSSLLIARFPKLIAWPLALLGGAFGSVGLVRALRTKQGDDLHKARPWIGRLPVIHRRRPNTYPQPWARRFRSLRR